MIDAQKDCFGEHIARIGHIWWYYFLVVLGNSFYLEQDLSDADLRTSIFLTAATESTGLWFYSEPLHSRHNNFPLSLREQLHREICTKIFIIRY